MDDVYVLSSSLAGEYYLAKSQGGHVKISRQSFFDII